MIKVDVVRISKLEDYERLMEIIPERYLDSDVIDRMKKYIGLNCIKILVEFPYNDRDYLSTYYIHYAKKFKGYEKNCYRLHILGSKDEHYGSLTLRPTVRGTRIGTSYLKPQILIREEAYLSLSKYVTHVMGREITNECFPWMMQETDISVCAHVSVWSILRYFGNKFKNCADTTMGEMIEKIHVQGGRKTPSVGLDPIEISDLFAKYDFTPIIVFGSNDRERLFLDEVISYIESGIPVVGIMPQRHHAVSILGHGKIEYEYLNDIKTAESLKIKGTNIILHSKLIRSLYVMEDNSFPYRQVTKDLPSKDSDVDYNLYEISLVVVPLYKKMHLSYKEVYHRYLSLVEAANMEWETPQVVRIYITSSNSLKKFAVESTDMSEKLIDIITMLNMPKFVWCIDIAGFDNYQDQLTSGRIIIDTTCASLENQPWILMHDSKQVIFHDLETRKNKTVKMRIRPYKIYINNLRPVKPIIER